MISELSKLVLKSPANMHSQLGWRARHDQISVNNSSHIINLSEEPEHGK